MKIPYELSAVKEVAVYSAAAAVLVATAALALRIAGVTYIPHKLELAATTVNVASIMLIRRHNLGGWILAVASGILVGSYSVFIAKIYGQGYLQLLFFAPTSLYATLTWHKKNGHEGTQTPTHMTKSECLMLPVFLIIFAYALTFVFKYENAYFKYADCAAVAFIMCGHLLVMLKRVEAWIIFTPGNVLNIVMYAIQDSYFIVALNAFFIFNGTVALISWWRAAATNKDHR